ncbi:MAG: hypothetical protein EOP10_15805 [Proteobacteria bacterium]|nr:MAG: hypothetical protein EOP10_15805 [Pseudomonadota bacterium]
MKTFESNLVHRMLGGLERQFYQQNLVGSTNIVCVLTFEGRLDSKQLKSALQKLIGHHPRLGSAIIADPYIRFSPLPSMDLPYQESFEGNWRSVLEEDLHRPYPGPQIFLHHLVTDGSTLLLGFNHAVVDGLSSLILARQLIELYNGHVLSLSPSMEAVEDRFPKSFRGLQGWWKAIRFILHLAKLRSTLQIGLIVPTRSTGSTGFKLSDTRDLNDLARARGSNFFALLSAVILKSVYEIYGTGSESSLSLNTPVSLRSSANIPSDEIGVFLAGHLALYSISPTTDPWTLARACFDTLKQGVAEGHPMLLTLLARGSRKPSAPKIPTKPSPHRPTVSISNLGRIEPLSAAQGIEVSEVHAVSAQSMKDPFAFVVASYREETFIDLQFSKEKLNRDEAEALLSAVRQKMSFLSANS